jgi:AraC-like DNA-binding protein
LFKGKNHLRRLDQRLHALGAQRLLHPAAAFHDRHLLQVGQELAIGRTEREGAIVTEGGGLSAVSTFSHLSKSFLLYCFLNKLLDTPENYCGEKAIIESLACAVQIFPWYLFRQAQYFSIQRIFKQDTLLIESQQTIQAVFWKFFARIGRLTVRIKSSRRRS